MIYLFGILFGLLILGVLFFLRKERFENLPIIATNHKLNLKMREISIREYDIASWEKEILKEKKLSGINRLVCDPWDAQIYFKNSTTVPLEEGYFVSLMEPTKAFHTECSFQWDGKTIGVLDRSGKLFVEALAKGYRINVTVVPIPKEQWSNLDILLEQGRFEAIVVYFIPKSPMNRRLLGQRLSIMGFKDLEYSRIQVTYPFIKETSVNLTDYFRGFTSYILARERETIVPAMQLQEINLIEEFITRLDISEDRFNPGYHCYGDETLDIKGLCNSKYTTFGTVKRDYTTWDAPCLQNEDCPFYKANRRYENTRGGCLAFGMCELPVGVKRLGFRKYSTDPPYQPICHGCVGDPNCCKKQGRPDYAFPNDRDERQKAGIALRE